MLITSIRSAFAFLLCLSFAPFVQAADAVDHLGVGDALPAGLLRSDSGAPVSLADAVAGKPTVLIFYRGGWCPYCTKHLAGLADIIDELKSDGVQLLAISPDRPSKLQEKESLGTLPYTLLSDSAMEVSSAFGIAFQVEDALVEKYKNSYGIDIEGDSGETHHLLPHPSVFVVDGDGIIQFAHVDPNYKKRLKSKKIVAAAKAAIAQ